MFEASEIHTILHENPYCSRRHLLLRKVHEARAQDEPGVEEPRPFGKDTPTDSLAHGTAYESRALDLFAERIDEALIVPDCAFTHAGYPDLCGKPDALLRGTRACVEVKCPVRPKPIQEWVRFYQHQCQAYLEILRYETCWLVVYDHEEDTIEVEAIARDPMWWDRVRPAMDLFAQQVAYYRVQGTRALEPANARASHTSVSV